MKKRTLFVSTLLLSLLGVPRVGFAADWNAVLSDFDGNTDTLVTGTRSNGDAAIAYPKTDDSGVVVTVYSQAKGSWSDPITLDSPNTDDFEQQINIDELRVTPLDTHWVVSWISEHDTDLRDNQGNDRFRYNLQVLKRGGSEASSSPDLSAVSVITDGRYDPFLHVFAANEKSNNFHILWRADQRGYPESGVTDDYDPTFGFWKHGQGFTDTLVIDEYVWENDYTPTDVQATTVDGKTNAFYLHNLATQKLSILKYRSGEYTITATKSNAKNLLSLITNPAGDALALYQGGKAHLRRLQLDGTYGSKQFAHSTRIQSAQVRWNDYGAGQYLLVWDANDIVHWNLWRPKTGWAGTEQVSVSSDNLFSRGYSNGRLSVGWESEGVWYMTQYAPKTGNWSDASAVDTEPGHLKILQLDVSTDLPRRSVKGRVDLNYVRNTVTNRYSVRKYRLGSDNSLSAAKKVTLPQDYQRLTDAVSGQYYFLLAKNGKTLKAIVGKESSLFL